MTAGGPIPGDGLSAFARTHLTRWGALWGAPDVADRVRVVVSGRLRTSLGLYVSARDEVRLARFLLDGPPSLLLEVLCHEAAHAVVHRRHGRRARPHGREWRALMRAAGYPGHARLPAERLAALPESALRRRALWLHRCARCGRERLAGRPVPSWRCAPCRQAGRTGALEIRRQPAAGTAAAP